MTLRQKLQTFFTTYRLEVLVFILAFAVRFLYLELSIAHYGGDLFGAISGADGYFTVAKNIIAGHGFTDSSSAPYLPYSFRPPLYFYFIVGSYWLFHGFLGSILLQMVIGSMLPVLGMILASYVLTSRRMIAAVGILLALEPSGILYSTFFYSEIVFIFLSFLSFWCLFRYFARKQLWPLLASAGLLGLACLTRPAVEYLPVFIAACMVWDARKHLSKKVYLSVIAYLLMFVAVITPWLCRNEVVFGVADLSPQLGVNLYTVLLPSVLSVEHGTSWQHEYDTITSNGVQGPNDADITKGKPYTRLAVPLLLEHKKGLVIIGVNTGVSFFTSDGVLDFLRHIGASTSLRFGKPALFVLFSSPATLVSVIAQVALTPSIFVLFGRIFWVVTTILFFIGSWWYLRREQTTRYASIMVVVVLYSALTTLIAGLGITARYRLPVQAFMFVFALYALAVLYDRVRRKKQRHHA